MSKETIIVGKIGGADWVSTNDGGVGQLLFKLQDAKQIKDSYDRLVEENAALREALRLKEAECEALAEDKQQLMSDCVLCLEELQAWADEFQESSADLLIEKVKASLSEVGGGDENQQVD